MKIGVPTEIKKHEYRVGLAPEFAAAYVAAGHDVYIQKGAGEGSSYPENLADCRGDLCNCGHDY